jgi:hypothetical protein
VAQQQNSKVPSTGARHEFAFHGIRGGEMHRPACAVLRRLAARHGDNLATLDGIHALGASRQPPLKLAETVDRRTGRKAPLDRSRDALRSFDLIRARATREECVRAISIELQFHSNFFRAVNGAAPVTCTKVCTPPGCSAQI